MAPNLRISEFSGGYYVAEMVVQPNEDGPLVDNQLFTFIKSKLYDEVSADPIFKLQLDGGKYFTPTTHNSIPPEVIGLPQEYIDSSDMSDDGKKENIYIVKPQQTRFIESLGGELTTNES